MEGTKPRPKEQETGRGTLPCSLPLHSRARRTHRRAHIPCALAIPTTRRHRVRHLHDELRQPGDTRTGGDGVGEGDGGYGRGGGSNSLGDKFSWFLRGVLLNPTTHQKRTIPAGATQPHFISPVYALVGYPNRDSTPFGTVLRRTWCLGGR